MADLNPQEQKVVEAMRGLGATTPERILTMDDIMKRSNLAKGILGNVVTQLVNKGVIKRVAREKAAGYYLIQA